MNTIESSEITFHLGVEHAVRVAGRLLRSHLGGYTPEDVVCLLIEKELKTGKSEAEILEMLCGPGLYIRLKNVKNDLFRSESARKRGGGEPLVPLEEAEYVLKAETGDPERELIEKEDGVRMNDLLTRLIDKAGLSETQLEILTLDRRGYSSAEIALELGIDVSIVYARRSEALRKLVSAARHFTRNER